MDQQAMIDNLRWWSQIYLWLAIGVPILGAILGGIAGGILNLKRHHIEGAFGRAEAPATTLLAP